MIKMTKSELDSVCELLTQYKFKTDIKNYEDLTCVICQGFLRNAQKSLCRCTYCFECFNSYLNGNEKYCPGKVLNCTQSLGDVVEYIQFDDERNKRIRDMIVKCPFESCSFKDHLIKMYRHINGHSNSLEPETQNNSDNEESLLDLIRTLQSEITKLKDIVHKQSRQIKELENKFEQSLDEIEQTKKSMDSKFNGFSPPPSMLMTPGRTRADSIESVVPTMEKMTLKCDSQLAVVMTPRTNYQFLDNRVTPVRTAHQFATTIKETGTVNFEPKSEVPSTKASEKNEFSFSKILYDTKIDNSIKAQSKNSNAVNVDGSKPENIGCSESQKTESPNKTKTARRKINRNLVTVGESKDQENEPPMMKGGESKLINTEPQVKPIEYKPQEMERPLTIVEQENKKLVEAKQKRLKSESISSQARRFVTLANNPDGLASPAVEIGDERCPFDWEFRVHRSVLVEEGIVTRVVSKPFYTYQGGYQLRLVVDPSATHLSVGFVVCRGAYNHQLNWPMRLDVVLSVLDQKDRKIYCSGIVFNHQSQNEVGVCSRPLRSQNAPYIYENFVELKKIASNSRVYQNQCIVIRCEVIVPAPSWSAGGAGS